LFLPGVEPPSPKLATIEIAFSSSPCKNHWYSLLPISLLLPIPPVKNWIGLEPCLPKSLVTKVDIVSGSVKNALDK